MRCLWSSVASAAALALLLGCGGGGGGGDGDDGTGDVPAPSLPTRLAFSGGAVDGVPMTITGDEQTLPVAGFGFRGTWDRTTNRYTLPANDTFLNVDLGPAGMLATRVTATLAWGAFMPPADAGSISAQSLVDASESPLFTGAATLTAISNAAVLENSSPFSFGGRVDLVGLQQTETDPDGYSVSTTGSVQLFISAN